MTPEPRIEDYLPYMLDADDRMLIDEMEAVGCLSRQDVADWPPFSAPLSGSIGTVQRHGYAQHRNRVCHWIRRSRYG